MKNYYGITVLFVIAILLALFVLEFVSMATTEYKKNVCEMKECVKKTTNGTCIISFDGMSNKYDACQCNDTVDGLNKTDCYMVEGVQNMCPLTGGTDGTDRTDSICVKSIQSVLIFNSLVCGFILAWITWIMAYVGNEWMSKNSNTSRINTLS